MKNTGTGTQSAALNKRSSLDEVPVDWNWNARQMKSNKMKTENKSTWLCYERNSFYVKFPFLLGVPFTSIVRVEKEYDDSRWKKVVSMSVARLYTVQCTYEKTKHRDVNIH